MKPAISWTSQQVALKCPRRYHYRYLASDPDGKLKALKSLLSVRELAGHVIHMALARAVRRIADGGRVSDQSGAILEAVDEFRAVVDRSKNARPGELVGGLQLAEAFNGTRCDSEIADWREMVPLAVGNGIRLMQYFGLSSNKCGYRLEAEMRGSFRDRGRDHSYVIDVLIHDERRGWLVLDWKAHTHGLTDTDLQQLALYQRALVKNWEIPPTRIFGFACDLLRERVVEHHYRAVENTFADHTSPSRSYSALGKIAAAKANPYPARPSLAACGICPFSSVCPDSALRPLISPFQEITT